MTTIQNTEIKHHVVMICTSDESPIYRNVDGPSSDCSYNGTDQQVEKEKFSCWGLQLLIGDFETKAILPKTKLLATFCRLERRWTMKWLGPVNSIIETRL